MIAITVRHLPPTDTKPRRLKVKAEGVPHLIFDANDKTPREAAERLCLKYDWPGQDLVEGHLPNGDAVFVFDPHRPAIRRALGLAEGLANAAFAHQEKAGPRRVTEDNLKAARQRWDCAREDLPDPWRGFLRERVTCGSEGGAE